MLCIILLQEDAKGIILIQIKWVLKSDSGTVLEKMLYPSRAAAQASGDAGTN